VTHWQSRMRSSSTRCRSWHIESSPPKNRDHILIFRRKQRFWIGEPLSIRIPKTRAA
jgi:hypothetical protein